LIKLREKDKNIRTCVLIWVSHTTYRIWYIC
jgi:hypothetical protein